ncbi:MAG: potassium-transporting ATPase subunit KdpC [Candidatus Omnitrophica bacterium]|nr:potassium-transporting ATPase subunit KdpC [Candidatus Omnitrophota bacterium]
MFKIIFRPLLVLLFFSVLTGAVYPLLITGLSQTLFPRQANGSIIIKDGKPIGSELIAQPFTQNKYFHGRPSAVYQTTANSSGSNYGPTSVKLMDLVKERVAAVTRTNPSADIKNIPADLVLASASGLDPHISPEAALLQVERIVQARNISKELIIKIINENIESQQAGFLGADRVNVLKLNLAIDAIMEAKHE